MLEETKKIRLNKVAREFGIGMSFIVDFLSRRGHPIEMDPNAIITVEEYNMLYYAFQSDCETKENADRIKNSIPPNKTIDELIFIWKHLQLYKLNINTMKSSTTNSSLSELIKNSVSTEFKHLYATLQSQNIQEGRAINSSTPETLCKEAAERVCNFILQSVQMEYTKERLSVLYEYEKQYLELIKDYKEEIKFSTNILEDIRKERASFFAETLKDVSNTLKETQVDDAVTSKWIESLVNSYSESLNLSQSLAEESVIKKFGEIKDKAKLTVDDDLIKDE